MARAKVLLRAACVMLLVACGSPDERKGGVKDAEPLKRPDSTEIALVLDPTVFGDGDEEELARWTEKLAGVYDAVPSRTCVSVFLVRHGAVGADADLHHCLPFDASVRGSRTRVGRLQASFDAAQRHYVAMWNDMHSPEQRERSQSCLFTTLARVGRTFTPEPRPRARRVLIIMSDLLEECDEWARVNLESALEQGKLPSVSATGLTNLSGVDAVYAIVAPHPRVRTEPARQQLEGFWQKTFRQVGGPTPSVVPRIDRAMIEPQ